MSTAVVKLTKNLPSTSLNWLDGWMDGQKDRYKCPFALWSFSHSSHAIYELKTCCVTNVLWTSTQLPLVLTEAQGGQKPSAEHLAESPELPWRSLLNAGPLSDVSPTHPPLVTWISTLLAPPLPISANDSVTLHSLLSSNYTVPKMPSRGQSQSRRWRKAGFWHDTFPSLCIFHRIRWIHTRYCSSLRSANPQSITFYLCISVNKVFFFSSHTCTTLIMPAITHS